MSDMDKHNALNAAHKAAKENGLGYAFAIHVPPNRNVSSGCWYVATLKPLLRDQTWTVIECRADGSEVLA